MKKVRQQGKKAGKIMDKTEKQQEKISSTSHILYSFKYMGNEPQKPVTA